MTEWLEFRPAKGAFDELTAREVKLVHFEMMSETALYIGIENGEELLQFWVSSTQPLRITHERSAL